jgi:hypothetical protein
MNGCVWVVEVVVAEGSLVLWWRSLLHLLEGQRHTLYMIKDQRTILIYINSDEDSFANNR